jgi:hypothetical protein
VQAGAALQPYGEVISKVLTRAIDNVAEAVLRSCGSNTAAAGGQQQQQQQMVPGLPGQQHQQRQQQLASETTQEGLAAAALVDVMLQVGPLSPGGGDHYRPGGGVLVDTFTACMVFSTPDNAA